MPDKDKVKDIYKKGLVSLEVLKLKDMPETVEEAEEIYNEIVKYKTYLIDDLNEPYVIRLAYTENKSKLKSIDPNRLDDMDAYELGESIQEILKENGFPVIKSEFPEMPDGYIGDAEIEEIQKIENKGVDNAKAN